MAYEELEFISTALTKFKRKIMMVVGVVIAGSIVSFPFTDLLINRIKLDLLPEGTKVIYLTPLEVLILKLKISLAIGALMALPLIVFEGYKILKERFPQMKLKNVGKSSIALGGISAILLFILGVIYTYFIMLPIFFRYLYEDAASIGVEATFSILEFVNFVLLCCILFGLVFEMPVFITMLVRLGIVDRSTLKYYRRHAYLLIVIAATWVTPGVDIISPILLTFPMIFFYELSILITKFTA
ncbi:MAG: twin-arginine translocase subunit TatC [Methanocellales archaeon]